MPKAKFSRITKFLRQKLPNEKLEGCRSLCHCCREGGGAKTFSEGSRSRSSGDLYLMVGTASTRAFECRSLARSLLNFSFCGAAKRGWQVGRPLCQLDAVDFYMSDFTELQWGDDFTNEAMIVCRTSMYKADSILYCPSQLRFGVWWILWP